MNHGISIRPSKDIRTNYAQISALTRQNPVAITVNGKEDTVLLSHEEYQEQLLRTGGKAVHVRSPCPGDGRHPAGPGAVRRRCL